MSKSPIPCALAAAAVACAAFSVHAADEEIIVGACQPITGRFAFAGVNINAGLQDYLNYASYNGIVKGKKFAYFYEDSGYDTEKAVATFKKIMAQYNPVMMYGESTGLGKAIGPELNSRYKVLYGSASFSSELADPKRTPSCQARRTPTCSASCSTTSRRTRRGSRSRRSPSSTAIPSSERTPSPSPGSAPPSWGSTWSPTSSPRSARWT